MEFILNLLEFNLKVPYQVVFAFLSLFVVVLWGSLVYYVWLDSSVYFPAKFSQVFFSVMTLIFGFGGLLVYLLYRGNSMEQRKTVQIENELFLRDAWLCSRCLKTVLSSERYCVNCGLPTKKKCEGCGNFNRPDNKYCQSCGRMFPSQKTKITVFEKEGVTLNLPVFQERLKSFWEKFRLELKNPRNFKFEPLAVSFIRKNDTNNNQTQNSEDK